MEIELEGLDELIDYLSNFEMNLDKAKNEALIAGGDLLKDRITAEIYSHGLNRRSGNAAESIIRTNPKNGELFVGTEGGKKQKGFYLYMHEFGFYNVRAKRFIAPKPLVSIVYESSKNDILDEYVKAFKRELGLS